MMGNDAVPGQYRELPKSARPKFRTVAAFVVADLVKQGPSMVAVYLTQLG